MKIRPSPATLPAVALPPPPAVGPVHIIASSPAAGGSLVPRAATDSFVENGARLLDAGGADGGWRGFALAGSGLGAASACVAIVRARRQGDRASAGAAWFKLGEATLGLVDASGLLHARPTLAGALKVTQTFLGKIGDTVKPADPPPDPFAPYTAFRTKA